MPSCKSKSPTKSKKGTKTRSLSKNIYPRLTAASILRSLGLSPTKKKNTRKK